MSKLTDYSKFDHIDDGSSDDEEQDIIKATSKMSLEDGSNSQQVPQQPQSTSAGTAPLPVSETQIPPISQPPPATAAEQTTPTAAVAAATGPSIRKKHGTDRYIYEFNGRPVYEWEQKLEDVTIYMLAPPVTSQQIHCQIFPNRLELGVKHLVETQGKYFLNEKTFGLVDVSESTWYLEDARTLVIYLAKAKKGEVWEVALMGTGQANATAGDASGSSNSENTATSATTIGVAKVDPMTKQEIQKEMMLERFQEENPGMDFRGAEFNGSVPDPRNFMGGVKYS